MYSSMICCSDTASAGNAGKAKIAWLTHFEQDNAKNDEAKILRLIQRSCEQ